MDPVTRYQKQRNAERDATSYYRYDARARTKAGRISAAPRNVATDSSGKRVTMPTSYQQGAGTAAAPAFQQSRGSRVQAAMLDGSFNSIRSKYNESNTGKQVMDEKGNIRAQNPYLDGGQVKADTPVPTAKPGTTPAAPGYKPPQQPAGPPSPKGRIMDGGVDVTADIQKGLSGDRTGNFYTKKSGPGASPGPDMNDPMMKSALAVQNAAKGINAAQAIIDKTPKAAQTVPSGTTINQPLTLGAPPTPATTTPATTTPATSTPATSTPATATATASTPTPKAPVTAPNSMTPAGRSQIIQDTIAGKNGGANIGPKLPDLNTTKLPPTSYNDVAQRQSDTNAAFTPPVAKAMQVGVGAVSEVAKGAGNIAANTAKGAVSLFSGSQAARERLKKGITSN